MDLYEKLTSSLEPLGGRLYVDSFVAALREAARRQQQEARAARPAQVRAPDPPAPAAKPAPRPDPDDRRGPRAVGSDSGKLRLEVEDFMRRGDSAETDDVEIQEFLKEKSGFDPTEFD